MFHPGADSGRVGEMPPSKHPPPWCGACGARASDSAGGRAGVAQLFESIVPFVSAAILFCSRGWSSDTVLRERVPSPCGRCFHLEGRTLRPAALAVAGRHWQVPAPRRALLGLGRLADPYAQGCLSGTRGAIYSSIEQHTLSTFSELDCRARQKWPGVPAR